MAGTAERTLALKLIADVGDLNKGMQKTQSTLKRTASAAKSWGKALTGALVIRGIETVVDSLGDALAGFKEGEQASRTLATTWRNLGRQGDQLEGVLDGLNTKALDMGFDDAEVVTAFNTFLAKTGSVKESTQGVARAMDLARAKGIPFSAAVKKVTASLGENDEALKRNKGQARQWARNHPMEVTLGKISDLWGDVVGNFSKGKLNAAFAALAGIGDQVNRLLFGWNEGGRHIPGIVDRFVEMGPRIVKGITDGLTTLGAEIQRVWDEQIATVDWGKVIPDSLSKFWDDVLGPFLAGLAEKGPVAAGAAVALAVGIGALVLPIVAATAPLILLAVTIGLAAAAIAILIDKLPGIQAELQKVEQAVGPILDDISEHFDNAFEHIGNLLKTLGDTVNTLLEHWNNLMAIVGGAGPNQDARRQPGESFEDWVRRNRPSTLGEGGIVTRPTLALIGEKGPEAVIPLTGPNAGGAGWTINVSVGVGDPVEIGRQVDRVLRAYRGRAGLPA